MAVESMEWAAGPEHGDLLDTATPTVPGPDPQLAAFVAAARHNLRANGIGDGRKGQAISVRVNPDLLAAAAARLGAASQTEVLHAGLAVLAGADTFGAWLLDQAGTLDPDLDVDV